MLCTNCYELWCNALHSHADPPYHRMICGKHFHKDDFSYKSKGYRLKANIVPTIFDNSQNNESDCAEENQASQSEPIDECQGIKCTESMLHHPDQATLKTLQDESNEQSQSYQLLYHQYNKEKGQMNVEMEKLKQRIKRLEQNLDNQKKHIRFLNQKLLRQQKSKDGLSNLLKELHAEKLLDAKNLKRLEVK